MKLRIALLFALALPAIAAAPAAAAPKCSPFPKSRTILEGDKFLENIYMDARQRIFFSDETANALMRLDRIGGKARKLTDIEAPGGIVQLPDGSLVVGYGDGAQNGLSGDQNPTAGLYRVNPDTGAKSVYAKGTGMSNGVGLAPDGTIYATNDFGRLVDRVKDGKVDHGWAEVLSGNGVVVSHDNRYVYVAQTFAPAAIQRITVANPSEVVPFFEGKAEDSSGGLDSMTQDARGNLFVAVNGGGQVWRVDTKARVCVLATGLINPSAVAFGTGRYARNMYVTTFGGQIVELAAVRGSRTPTTLPATGRAATRGTVAGRVRGARGRTRVTVRRGGKVLRRKRGRRYRFRLRAARHYRLRATAHRARCHDRIVFVRAGRTVRANVRCRRR
jgi:sugar lactone lactonase YvrE